MTPGGLHRLEALGRRYRVLLSSSMSRSNLPISQHANLKAIRGDSARRTGP